MAISFRPLGKRVLLSFPEQAPESVVGGIIVQRQDARSDYRKAIVVRLPDRYQGPLCSGDTVYVKPWCGTEVKINGVSYAVVPEPEILAVLEG